MVTVISRFRVLNGMEEAVRRAFACRPHLVDGEPGFCDFNVVTDAADPAIFLLITRWLDEKSFRSWHASDAHHRSHDWMPKGIKLDPAFTMLIVGHNIADSSDSKDAVTHHTDCFPKPRELVFALPKENTSND
jgi:heme-degrading monooxygenase HmoA